MIYVFILSALLAGSSLLMAAEGEKHKEDEHEHSEHEGDKNDGHGGHGDEHSDKHVDKPGEKHDDGHGDKHAEGESKVGPGKGIAAASEELGIKLSPQAVKSFEVTTLKVAKLPMPLPVAAQLFLADDVELYRLRDGFYKRIDFKKLPGKPLLVSSPDLRIGDEIVTAGVKFIRIAEIAAFGGAPEGHSH